MPYSAITRDTGIPQRVKFLIGTAFFVPLTPLIFGGLSVGSFLLALGFFIVPGLVWLKWHMGLMNKMICPNCRMGRVKYFDEKIKMYDVKDMPRESINELGKTTFNSEGQEMLAMNGSAELFLCHRCRTFEIVELN